MPRNKRKASESATTDDASSKTEERKPKRPRRSKASYASSSVPPGTKDTPTKKSESRKSKSKKVCFLDSPNYIMFRFCVTFDFLSMRWLTFLCVFRNRKKRLVQMKIKLLYVLPQNSIFCRLTVFVDVRRPFCRFDIFLSTHLIFFVDSPFCSGHARWGHKWRLE